MQTELEPGGDAKVSSTTTDCPEQVRVCLGVHAQDLPVGGNDLGGQKIVDGEAVLAYEHTDPAAQRDPPDPHRAGIAETGGKPVSSCRGCVFACGQPCLCPRRAAFGIDVQGSHIAEIEHDPPIGNAVTGGAVTTAANGELYPVLAGE